MKTPKATERIMEIFIKTNVSETPIKDTTTKLIRLEKMLNAVVQYLDEIS